MMKRSIEEYTRGDFQPYCCHNFIVSITRPGTIPQGTSVKHTLVLENSERIHLFLAFSTALQHCTRSMHIRASTSKGRTWRFV